MGGKNRDDKGDHYMKGTGRYILAIALVVVVTLAIIFWGESRRNSSDGSPVVSTPSPVASPRVEPTPAPTVEPTPAPTPGSGFVAEITAIPNLRFDKKEITVPVGEEVTLRFINKDGRIYHNIAVYRDKSAKEKIAVGKICAAPCENTISFILSQASQYFFRCDVHPQQMTGTLIGK